MKLIFGVAGGLDIPEEEERRRILYDLLRQVACQTKSKFLCETNFSTSESRWALAYVLSWLRVAGGDSVLPPWVRLENRRVVTLIKELRDVPCDDSACAYCSSVHNPEVQLKQFFGFDSFRPTPQYGEGGSLQRRIVQAGMRNESILAIMPTDSSKSLCFQLPALVSNFRRGQLTIVISPLQALMKDQVDGLVPRTGLHNAAALYGLLTHIERKDVLRRVRMGNIGILYVAPNNYVAGHLETPFFNEKLDAG